MMISQEKQILLESFNRRSLKRSNTKKIMDIMFQNKKNEIRRHREEEYDNKVREWKKQKTFDINTMFQNVSPTSRSTVRSFKKLNEEKDKFYTELDEIIKELESD